MGLQSASGGLTKSKLEQATAVPGDVVAGKTFYSGDKELKTGALTEMPAINHASGVSNDGDDVLFTIENGAYRTNNSTYNKPEIRATKSEVMRYGIGMAPTVSYTFSGTVWGKGYTLGNASATGTMKISGLPYTRMTTSNANGCSASYSNGTLTVTLNKGTGEFTGSGMKEKTVNWSITCNMYMT